MWRCQDLVRDCCYKTRDIGRKREKSKYLTPKLAARQRANWIERWLEATGEAVDHDLHSKTNGNKRDQRTMSTSYPGAQSRKPTLSWHGTTSAWTSDQNMCQNMAFAFVAAGGCTYSGCKVFRWNSLSRLHC